MHYGAGDGNTVFTEPDPAPPEGIPRPEIVDRVSSADTPDGAGPADDASPSAGPTTDNQPTEAP
jgi:hypothetical protein